MRRPKKPAATFDSVFAHLKKARSEAIRLWQRHESLEWDIDEDYKSREWEEAKFLVYEINELFRGYSHRINKVKYRAGDYK